MYCSYSNPSQFPLMPDIMISFNFIECDKCCPALITDFWRNSFLCRLDRDLGTNCPLSHVQSMQLTCTISNRIARVARHFWTFLLLFRLVLFLSNLVVLYAEMMFVPSVCLFIYLWLLCQLFFVRQGKARQGKAVLFIWRISYTMATQCALHKTDI